MASKTELDSRLNPRIKAYFAWITRRHKKPGISWREQLLKQEEELISLTNMLSACNKDLERCSFMISHDLRGPLSTLMGISEVIDTVKLDKEDLSFFINGIKESLLKIDKTIRVLNDIIAGMK